MYTSTCAKEDWGFGSPLVDVVDKGYMNDRFNGCIRYCEDISFLDYGCELEEIARCKRIDNGEELSNVKTQSDCLTYGECSVDPSDITSQSDCTGSWTVIPSVWEEKKCFDSNGNELLFTTENGGLRSYTFREKDECSSVNGTWRF